MINNIKNKLKKLTNKMKRQAIEERVSYLTDLTNTDISSKRNLETTEQEEIIAIKKKVGNTTKICIEKEEVKEAQRQFYSDLYDEKIEVLPDENFTNIIPEET